MKKLAVMFALVLISSNVQADELCKGQSSSAIPFYLSMDNAGSYTELANLADCFIEKAFKDEKFMTEIIKWISVNNGKSLNAAVLQSLLDNKIKLKMLKK